MLRIAALILLLLTAAVWPAAAEYPERPLTILTGYPAGGMVDIVARALGEGMKKKYPKGIAIVTRPGAGGSLAVAELVAAVGNAIYRATGVRLQELPMTPERLYRAMRRATPCRS